MNVYHGPVGQLLVNHRQRMAVGYVTEKESLKGLLEALEFGFKQERERVPDDPTRLAVQWKKAKLYEWCEVGPIVVGLCIPDADVYVAERSGFGRKLAAFSVPKAQESYMKAAALRGAAAYLRKLAYTLEKEAEAQTK